MDMPGIGICPEYIQWISLKVEGFQAIYIFGKLVQGIAARGTPAHTHLKGIRANPRKLYFHKGLVVHGIGEGNPV
jgi:hypothetical protein